MNILNRYFQLTVNSAIPFAGTVNEYFFDDFFIRMPLYSTFFGCLPVQETDIS